MNIYVASSWRNEWQPQVVELLREDRHSVYDFRAPAPGVKGFSWSDVDPNWKRWTPRQYRDALGHPIARAGFMHDLQGMLAAEATLLVMPAGRSAHLELGWACGAERKTAIWYPPTIAPAEPSVEAELMAKLADRILVDWHELAAWSKEHAQ